jgi:hypothetical protein
MGVYAPATTGAVQAQAVAFGALQVELTEQAALADWHRAELTALADARQAEAAAEQQAQQAEAQQQTADQADDRRQLQQAYAGRPAAEAEAARARLDTRHQQEAAAMAQRHAAAVKDQEARYQAAREAAARRQQGETVLRKYAGPHAAEDLAAPGAARRWQEQAAKEAQAKAAAAAAHNLTERRGQAVEERFRRAAAEAGPAPAGLTEADRQVLREYAQRIERAQAEGVHGGRAEPADAFELKSQAARDRILQRGAAHANPEGAPPRSALQPSLTRLPDVDAPQRQLFRAAEQAVELSPELGPVGRQALADLERLAPGRPGLVEQIRTHLRTFQEPVTRRSLTNRLAVNLLGWAVSGPSPDAAILLEGLNTPEVRAAAEKAARLQVRDVVTRAVETGGFDAAERRLAEGPAAHPAVPPEDAARLREQLRHDLDRLPTEQAAHTLRHRPPSLADVPEPHARVQDAGQHLAGLSQRIQPDQPQHLAERLGEPLARFDDHFPGQFGAEHRTERGRMVAGLTPPAERPNLTPPPAPPPAERPSGGGGGWGGGGGGGGGWGTRPPPAAPPVASARPTPAPRPSSGGVAAAPPSARAATNFFRARSFGALRGFSRVGGVLIGREPEAEQAEDLDLRDLDWEETAEGVRLRFRDAQGQVLRTPAFRKPILHHALTYAADGRPLTVTMITAEPLPEMRVLLHPTLLDTPLGYRLIELDRFVDQFTGEKEFPQRKQAILEVEAQTALYRLAVARRALLVLDHATFQEAGKLFQVKPEALAAERRRAEAALADARLQTLAGLALKQGPVWDDPVRCPLRAKPEFFDARLVDALAKTAGKSKEVAGVLDAMAAALKAGLEAQAAAYDRALNRARNAEGEAAREKAITAVSAAFRNLLRWLNPAPEYILVSGVRELPYHSRLAELLPHEGAESPQPFRFMLQMAFTSAPEYLPAKEDGEDAVAAYVDDKPWEFPFLGDDLHQRTVTAVSRDARSRTILADAAEFARLQRLFRAALRGRLGKQFPLEKLVALTDATAPAPGANAGVRTPRWNSGGGFRALAQERGRATNLLDTLDKLEGAVAVAQPPVARALGVLRPLRPLLEERRKAAAAHFDQLAKLLDPETRPEEDDDALAEAREAFAAWGKVQDDWQRRWGQSARLGDLRRLRPGDAPADKEDDPRRLLQRLIDGLEDFNLIVPMRYQLGLHVDDLQAVEEQIRDRPLPPLK